MGGHGGLNILPQKRWNVYNFENRERVRKDEEEAARQEQAAQLKAGARDAEFRVEKLREIARLKRQQESVARLEGDNAHAICEDSSAIALSVRAVDRDAERPQHFNLFAELEAREREEELKTSERHISDRKEKGDCLEKKADDKGKAHRKGKDEDPLKQADYERHGLGYGSYEKSGKRPWYMTKSSLTEEDDSEVQRYVIPSAIKNGKKCKKTIEELRAERIKREEQEKLRASKLLSPTIGGPRGLTGVENSRGLTGVQNSSYRRKSHFHYNSGFGNSW